jgi:hypothetical protein
MLLSVLHALAFVPVSSHPSVNILAFFVLPAPFFVVSQLSVAIYLFPILFFVSMVVLAPARVICFH